MNEQAIREFIRANLVIEEKPVDAFGPGNSVKVRLRFADEPSPFSETVIFIPEFLP